MRVRNRPSIHVAWALIASLPVGLLAPAPASAQSQPAERTYAIPAGPLSVALARFASEAGVLLSADARLTDGKTTSGLNGRYGVQAGLNALLVGTGLEARAGTSGGFVVQPAVAPAPGEQQLPEVKVQSNTDTQREELPRPYAGGQVARGGRLGILGNRDMMDTPFSQSNYTAELIQNQQARFVSEVLDNDPSAHAAGGRTMGVDGFTIRGFTVGNGQLLFNGMPGIAPSGQDSVPLAESFERVEVFKGPSGLLNGNLGNAVGGVINLVPKRAGAQPLTQFTADYTTDSQLGGHVDVGRRFGVGKQFGIRLNGVYRDGDTPIDNLSRRGALAAVGFDYQGERVRVEADLGYQENKTLGVRRFTRMAAGVPVPGAPDNHTNWFHPAEYTSAEDYYGAMRGEFDLTQRVTLFLATGAKEAKQTRFSPNRTLTSVNGTLAAGTFPGDVALQKLDNATTEGGVQARFETGPVRHQLALAFSVSDQDLSASLASGAPATPFPVSNIYNPVFGATPNPRGASFGNVRKSSDTTLTSYVVADTLSAFDERVLLTLGARSQRVDTTGFNTATGAVISRYDEDKVTPVVGLVVKPRKDISLYGNYIEGLQQGPVAPLGTANAGQVFAPFAAKQYEVGAKLDRGNFATTLALYQIALPSTVTDAATNVFSIAGEQRHRGVDLNVFGEVTKGVRLLGGVAYIDSELTKTQGGLNNGNKGIAAPEWRAVLVGEWDTPFAPGLTLTGRVIRNGSVYLDAANRQELPAWTRVDIGARYRVNKTTTLRALINNVFDQNYWSATSDVLVLSEPRTFTLAATFDF